MDLFVLLLAIISQFAAVFFLFKKLDKTHDRVVVILIYLLGIYSVWSTYITEQSLKYWMLILYIVYHWCWGWLILYINKKIKEQTG